MVQKLIKCHLYFKFICSYGNLNCKSSVKAPVHQGWNYVKNLVLIEKPKSDFKSIPNVSVAGRYKYFMLHKMKILHPRCTDEMIFLVLTLFFYFCIFEGSSSRSPSRGPGDMRPPLPIPSRQTVHQTNTEDDEVQNMNHNCNNSKFSGFEREHLSKLFF